MRETKDGTVTKRDMLKALWILFLLGVKERLMYIQDNLWQQRI